MKEIVTFQNLVTNFLKIICFRNLQCMPQNDKKETTLNMIIRA